MNSAAPSSKGFGIKIGEDDEGSKDGIESMDEAKKIEKPSQA